MCQTGRDHVHAQCAALTVLIHDVVDVLGPDVGESDRPTVEWTLRRLEGRPGPARFAGRDAAWDGLA